MKRTRMAVSGAVLTLGVLTACGGAEGEAASQPEFPLSGLQEYETPDQIASDLTEGGFACERFERQTGSMNAASSGNCWWSGGAGSEQEIILMIFNSDANKEEQADLLRDMGAVFGIEDWEYGFVEGGNWMVNCGNRDACDGVAGALGGRMDVDPLI